MNTMSTMVIIQFIYLKLGKKGPNTHKCVYTPTPATENELVLLVFSSHSLSTKLLTIVSKTDYHHSLTISYTK